MEEQTTECAMTFKSTIRRYHNILSLFIIAPLFLTAATGVLYQIGKLWFGISKENLKLLLRLHQMSILGETAKAIYAPTLGFFSLFMICSGIYMMFQGNSPLSSLFAVKSKWTTFRGLHRNLSVMMWIPFLLTVVCGALYRTLKTWFDMDKLSVGFLLNWHQGKFIDGLGIEYVYPVVVGIVALVSMVAGITMNKSFQGISKNTGAQFYTLPGGEKKADTDMI
jgi:hypothetical protein